MKNQILLTVLLTSLFWVLGCYAFIDLTRPKCVDCEALIKENNQKYQNELNSLHLLTDSLNQEVTIANSKTDSLRTSISIRSIVTLNRSSDSIFACTISEKSSARSAWRV